jgi:hypothetical protein
MKIKENPALMKTTSHSGEILNSGYLNQKIRLFFFLVTGLFLFPAYSSGQCESDAFLDKCASNLGTYNYIKSFVASANPRKKASSEFTYVFSKGSTYMMIACTENSGNGKMVISLYDRDHNLIASTYDEKTKKYYPDLQYPCSATGVYYIKATIEGTKNGCGLCILGFSKD